MSRLCLFIVSVCGFRHIRLNKPVRITVVFINLVGEDRADLQIMIPGLFLLPEQLIVFHQGLDVGNAENCGELAAVGLAFVIRNNIVDNRFQTLGRLHYLSRINGLHFNVFDLIFLLDGANVFHRELEYVLVTDRIRDDIFMQTFIEQVFRGAFSVYVGRRVLGKYRGTGKTKHLHLEGNTL